MIPFLRRHKNHDGPIELRAGNDKEDSVKPDRRGEQKNGVIYSALSANGNGSNYAADLKGYADDDGGYVELNTLTGV